MTIGLILKALLGVFAVVTLIPVSTAQVKRSDPHPVADYPTAVATFQKIAAAETASVGVPGRSILMVHGEKTPHAIILMHGMTNVPRQFIPLGNVLYECGYNVYIPRLPLHGLKELNVSVLKKLRPEMYRAYADSAVDLAVGLGDTLTVVGLSAGGSTAAWTAEHRPEVYRAVVIAPALALQRIPRFLRGPAVNLFTRIPNITFHQPADTSRFVYRGVSTKGVSQTLRFGRAVYQEAADKKPIAPYIAVVTNSNDHTIDSQETIRLAERWRQNGANVMEFQFGKTLDLQHDVIDTMEQGAKPEIVYPVVLDLIDGVMPTVVGDSVVTPRPRCSIPKE